MNPQAAAALLQKRMPDMVIRGVAVVRGADGKVKMDSSFDASTLSERVRSEINDQQERSE